MGTVKKVTAVLLSSLLMFQSLVLALPPGETIVIAIVDFKNTSNNQVLNYLEKAIPESVITSMARSGQLEIVERGRLQDAISEMQLGMSGIVDEQTAVEVGRAVGANAILVGSFVTIGEMIQINARLIDVESSKIIKADTRRGAIGEEIFELMDQMAQSMEYQMVGDRSRPVAIQQVSQADLQKNTAQTQMESPFYSRWWFWTIVGVGVVGGTAYAMSAGGGESNISTVSVSVPLP
ncbi:MAG: CsgG/HfaB family protein [Candidatus Marinimicrobia bacterium]|nr:CsgG/HfaB family protein [Candidatus Neomarinimicrobiota bacterium]MCF7828863.1 CsgG/HfaB family protein [Candidatus Neomarinimicrobiota bacterium]MCF7880780.1 CsgG/HfaB family protein [Candidatus Neomarinimicrobiota bacterium]